MREAIYIKKHFDSIKNELIIEEDNHSIWAYLLDLDNDNKIVMDGFLCSTGTIVEKLSDIKEFLDKDFAPPISKDFVIEFTVQKGLRKTDFKIETFDKKIIISIKEVIYLILDLVSSNSYSKSISKPGSYGLPINKNT